MENNVKSSKKYLIDKIQKKVEFHFDRQLS